jgi:class 3 adenylate cyclase/tetratricopeptide (TPR) repeat protein
MQPNPLQIYLPQDRRRVLAGGRPLPDRTEGTALFADISGFTPLTEALRQALGARLGAEELTRYINMVYDVLVAAVERYGGSVISFAGDSMLCWFDAADGKTAPRALACARDMQSAMQEFKAVALPNGKTTALTLKIAVASGTAQRFIVGYPAIHYLDTLAGATIVRTAAAEHLAQKGEILVDEATLYALSDPETIRIHEWRTDPDSQEAFAVLESYAELVAPTPLAPLPELEVAQLRAWLHKEQIADKQVFQTEFRPVVTLFVRFIGIDFDSDAAHEQLNMFIQQAQLSTARYGGAILQLTIGDKGSYALIGLGALSTHEDDAQRALKLALNLRDNASMLGFLQPLQIGISIGTALVGPYGGQTRSTYSVQGDEVNLAARLMQAAAPGEILVTEQLQKMYSAMFTFEARPPLSLKGKAAPVRAFLLAGEQAQRAIRLQEPTYTLPMVGRERELQLIEAHLDAVRQGKAQVIGIVGGAGMGKSRLVAEVIRLARQKGFAGFGGACQADSIDTPYQAWRSIWTAFFNLDTALPFDQRQPALDVELERYAPHRRVALPLLGIVLGIDIPNNDFTRSLESKYRQSALHALLEDCLRAAAQSEPLLIVIEDLHWIDPLSHDLLEALARLLVDVPICFILAYRPPQLARLEAQRIEALPHFTRLVLSELDTAEATQALHTKLAQLYPAPDRELPPFLIEKLTSVAQGNPFFLEELVNYLHDQRLDPYDPETLERVELPDSLHTLIISRIDQLCESEKNTLSAASVIGRLFRVGWLTGYYPDLGDAAALKATLDQLSQMEITLPDETDTALAYLFKHIVTHEVIYEKLPFATRARLHEQLAQYLETEITAGTLSRRALLDNLVYHYLRSRNLEKQRAYLHEAAQAALTVSAGLTAAAYLTRLLELTPEGDPLRSSVARQLAEAYRYNGDYTAARAALEQAQAAAQTEEDQVAAFILAGALLSQQGDYQGAQAVLTEALPLARQNGNQPNLCRALYTLGVQRSRLGKPDEARPFILESLEIAEALDDLKTQAQAYNLLAIMAARQGAPDAGERFQNLYTWSLEVGDRLMTLMALTNLGVLAEERTEYQVAREHFQEALRIAYEIGAQDSIALSLVNIANEEIKLREFALARAHLVEGLRLSLRIESFPRVIQTMTNYSELVFAEGNIDYALQLMGMVRQHPAAQGQHQHQIAQIVSTWELDPTLVEAGMASGATLDWETILQELLVA